MSGGLNVGTEVEVSMTNGAVESEMDGEVVIGREPVHGATLARPVSMTVETGGWVVRAWRKI